MKIIARIVKTENGQYLFNGQVYDSILSARREMNKVRRPRPLVDTPRTDLQLQPTAA